jgi:hypothetical protein
MDEFRAVVSQCVLYLVHEPFQPLRGGRPLGLLGRELVGRLPDLLRRRVHLVRGGLLLLGGQDRLLEQRRGRGHQLADLIRLPGALLGGHDRRIRLVLDAGDDHADRLGRSHRPFRQLAYFGRDHREAPACLAGPGGLDRRVQREQVGLPGYLVDQLEDLADLLTALAE